MAGEFGNNLNSKTNDVINNEFNIDGIDELDAKILSQIKDNARLSYSEIAENIGGISRVSVKNRIKALEDRKIIQGYKTVINPTGDPNGIKFFMDIEAEPEIFYDVVEALAGYRCSRQIYTASGESRIHVIGYAPNNATLRTYVDRVYKNTKGIRRLVCHQLLVTHKDVDGGVEYVRQNDNRGDN